MISHNYSSANWAELYGGEVVNIFAYEPDPNSSHEDFYYNSTENKLYRLTTIINCKNNTTKKSWKQINKPAC